MALGSQLFSDPSPLIPQFEEIHEVIARYKTLVSMHHDLMQSAQEGQEKIERAKARLARYMEEKDDEILQHNNELARLQMRFDRARSDVIFWVSFGPSIGLVRVGVPGYISACVHTHRERETQRVSTSPVTLTHIATTSLPRNLAGHTSKTRRPRRPSCLAPLRWRR